jgi:rubrerythrin
LGDGSRSQVDVLTDAVRMELEGKDYFERASQRMSVPRARDMFIGLVKQEQRHVDVLSEQLRRLKGGSGWTSMSDALESSPDATGTSVFQDKDLKRIVLREGAGELEVLELAMEVEKKSIDYYESSGAASEDPKAREVYSWLVEEEKGHLMIIRAEHDLRAKSRFYYDSAEFSLEVE